MPFFKKRIPALLGPDNRTLKLSTAAPGGRNERSLKLHRNSDYEIRLRWLATREGEDMDWYCWEAKVDGLPTQATYESYDGTRLPKVAEFFPVANSWIVDNREGLLTSHVHMNAEEGGNVAGGKVAYLRKVDLISPAGNYDNDPVAKPIDGGDGTGTVPDGANEFTFSSATNGVLTVQFKAEVGGGSTVINAIKDKVTFSIENVGQAPTWDPANPGGKASVSENYLIATATFTGLPANNSDFGKKKVELLFDGSVVEEAEIEVFYPGTANNHQDQANRTFPNWFVYYKQNGGGGAYTYDGNRNTSASSAGGGDSSIRIANNAYTGGDTLITSIGANGRLQLQGRTPFRKRYKYFYGVVQHERQHANNETTGASDVDGDFLSSSFELSTSKTDPNDKFSADPNNSVDDGEVYAGGPVEQAAINEADTSMDWANPGTNNINQ